MINQSLIQCRTKESVSYMQGLSVLNKPTDINTVGPTVMFIHNADEKCLHCILM